MKQKLLYIFFISSSISVFGQPKNIEVAANDGYFKSVFSDMKSGVFDGTANGVLFIQNPNGQDLILDFQASESKLSLEPDEYEVYDVSTKKYRTSTTSGKSTIEYRTYALANEMMIKLANDTFAVGSMDGAADLIIRGLKYYYKAEKGAEYLVLRVERELTLSNYDSLVKNLNDDDFRNETKMKSIEQKTKSIKLLPNSTLIFAIKRIK